MLSHAFSPMKIGSCEIPNRFVVPAMVTNYCAEDGTITDRYIAYMEEKAKGGYGLLITEDYAIEPHGKGYARIPGLFNDDQIDGNKKLTEAIHKHGAKIFCQIYHPGKQATMDANGGVVPIAPSAIKDPICQTQPREITVDEIHQLVKDFGQAAIRIKKAGFDGIEIHAGHGYLIGEFLSPFINKRNDNYGGCMENRMRFLDEIILEIRKCVGDFPLQIRFSANEYVVGGQTEIESYQLAMHLDEMGVDSLNISNGNYSADAMHQLIAPMFVEHGINVKTANAIKEMVSCPVLVANRINNPNMVEMLIATGKVDFVCIGRGSIADPHMPNKAKAGKFNEINYCLGCLQGCITSLLGPKGEVDCLVNPNVGCEYKNSLEEAKNKKKVMVIGAGPGGLAATRTAAMRGHEVALYEASNHIGGAFRAAAFPSGKGELSTLTASYFAECESLGVEIHMETPVTEELIQTEKPDSIIIATGSRPFMPGIKGIDSENVITAEDVLYGDKPVLPGPTVVCGGGEVGGETAEFISCTSFSPVYILEMQDEILKEMAFQNKLPLMDLLKQKNVQIITGAKVFEITDHSVSYVDRDGNTIELPATTVVSAFGYRSYNPLEEVARTLCNEVYSVGSAVKAGNAMVAIREGYEAAIRI